MSKVKIGIIGGSGMDDPDIFKNKVEKKVCTPFGEPSDSLLLGEVNGVECILLARHGRKHNIMPSNVNYRANIWAMKAEGCTHIIATTATGSLQEDVKAGDLVILDNFIDRTTSRKQTFYDGEPGHPTGVAHIPMEPAYCQKTRETVIEVADELGIAVRKSGTVVVIEGPRFSSKAESNIYRMWGGTVVTMTPVPELILAKEAGICYASIALVTDYDCWRDTGERVCVTEVVKTFKDNANKVTKLIQAVVTKVASKDWTQTINELKELVENSRMDH